ncbi:MAG: lycopene cyclase domain-containing protein [Micrococcus sp.]|nr:lycopene cyclase domain-containing protein [Micrococcus sp.]
MTYLLISLPFLAVAAAVLAVAAARGRVTRRYWAGMGLALVLLTVLTAVFDSLIIGFGIVDYTEANISGLRIGLAPIEDFTYPLAGVALLTGLWVLARGRRRGGGGAVGRAADRVSYPAHAEEVP